MLLASRGAFLRPLGKVACARGMVRVASDASRRRVGGDSPRALAAARGLGDGPTARQRPLVALSRRHAHATHNPPPRIVPFLSALRACAVVLGRGGVSARLWA